MKIENENGKPIKATSQQLGHSARTKTLILQYDNTNVKTCAFGKFPDEFVGQRFRFSVINQGIFSDKSNFGRDLCHMPINNLNQADKKNKERYFLNAPTNHLHLNAPVANLVVTFPR